MRRLRAFGLRIRSDVDMPGSIADEGAEPADFAVTRGRITDGYEGPTDGPYRLASAGLLFEAPGVARYAIDAAGIVVEPTEGADEAAVAALLIATAVPAALWMRGGFLVHACAFVPQGWQRAIAVTAPSGGGKSSVLHHAAQQGAAVVADDVVHLEVDGGRAFARGLCGGHFLGSHDRRRFHVAERPRETAPIAALVSLTIGADARAFEAIDPQAAVARLMHARHRPRVPALLGRDAATLNQAALLARALPIYRMAVTRDDDPATTAAALIAAIGERQGCDA